MHYKNKIKMNEYIIYEIMNIESDDSSSLFNVLNLLNSKVNVDLLTNEKNEIFYNVNLSDILKSDLTMEDILYVRNGGWELSNDKKNIVKFLK